jgi:DHA1 family inner membrane transport protein
MLEKRKPLGLYTQLAILSSSRTIINTGVRMVYPLLPVFSRELQVELGSFALVISASQFIGLGAPFLGTISERYGRRFTILLGMMIFNIGMLAVLLLPNFWGFALALLLGAVGKLAFDPSLQAYFGERVPYEKRGMVLGIIELAWSGAFFLGIPFVTWLLGTFNWQAPFVALSVLGMIGFAAALLVLGETPRKQGQSVSFITGLREAVQTKAAAAGIALIICITFANQLIGVTFATWLEDSFGIMLSLLALASFVIGIAELSGEGLVVFFSDRFGKRRLVFMGMGANILICLLLPFTGVQQEWAIFGLFCYYLSFELGLVASIPLFSELSPNARAMYMTIIAAASTFGRGLSTPLATYLYGFGMLAPCILALSLNAIALLLLWRYIDLD